jgi:hypothetical protein
MQQAVQSITPLLIRGLFADLRGKSNLSMESRTGKKKKKETSRDRRSPDERSPDGRLVDCGLTCRYTEIDT